MADQDRTVDSRPDDEPTVSEHRVLGNRYEILAPIAAGGFGTVYKGRDLLLGRTVAIKVLHPSRALSPEAQQRFLREARATARLLHDNIVTVFDAGDAEGQLFLVLEYVEGRPLSARLAQGAPSAEETRNVVVAIARALDAAHRMGIVHRDIKPANVLIRDDGHVKVADFGVARLADDVNLTREGAIIGTPKYMSPEQLEGDTVTPASDLFSLGCVAYEMLTGRTPFDGDTLPEVMANVRSGRVRPIPTPIRDDRHALISVVDQLLQPNPADRPESAAAVVAQLSGERGRPRRASRRPLIAAAITAAVVIAIAAFMIRRHGSSGTRNVAVHDAASVVSLLATRTGAVLPSGRPLEKNDVLLFSGGRGRPSFMSRPKTSMSLAGLTFSVRRRDANHVEIRAPATQLDAATLAVQVQDALSGYHFGQEPNLIIGDGASKRVIAIRTRGTEPHRLIELIASAAGWQVIVDPSAEQVVRQKLALAAPPDDDLHAPWDSIVVSLMHRYDLALFRLQRTWILTSLARFRELNQRRPLIDVFVPIEGKGSADEAARSAAAAASPRGTVLVNRRLNGLLLSDYPEVIAKEGDVLQAIGAIERRFGRQGSIETRTYSGKPCDVHLHGASIRDFMFLVGRLTGLSVLADPRVSGTVDVNLENVPWDEAVDAALSVTRTTFYRQQSVMELTPEKEKPPEEVVVQTVKLRHDDPMFWAPLQKAFRDRGGDLIVDTNARAVILRDTKTRVESFRNIMENLDAFASPAVLKPIVDDIKTNGVASGIALERRLALSFDESDWNRIGYVLLRQKHFSEAIAILKKNAADHPQSWNVYDSLAEAYMTAGQKRLAIENYRQSLSLNPRNDNARRMLAQLQ